MKQKNVDGGYAWITLAGCFLLYMLAMGTLKVFGILYKELMDIYKLSAGSTAFVGSIASFATAFFGPFANTLSTKYSFRKVTFTGSFLIGMSYFFSSFVYELEFMFITYSLLAGIGFGLTFVPCATLINFYFEKRRALANGIVVSASGVGMFLFSYLYRYLFDHYGFRGGLLVLSGILFNCCAVSLLFEQPIQLLKTKTKSKEAFNVKDGVLKDQPKNENDTLSNNLSNLKQPWGRCKLYAHELAEVFIPRFSLFKNLSFCIYNLAFTMTFLGYASNIYMLPPHIGHLGYNEFDASTALTILAISEVVARIFVGWFTDLKIISARTIYLISMSISGVSAILVTFTTNFTLICIYSACVGIFPGTFYTLMPLFLIKEFGLENLPATYGLVTLSMAFAFLIVQAVLGWLDDITGNWRASFCTSGGCLLVACFLVLLEGVLYSKKNRENEKEESNEETNKDEEVSMLYDLPVE